MKIHEYNQMMNYLTRDGRTSISGGPVLKGKPIQARTALKKGSSDTKPAPKNNKMLQYIDDHNIVYGDKKSTKAELEAATKRIEAYPKKMSKQNEYNTYFNKKSPKYYNKKVVDKPKSNGKYIMPKFKLDSFDWDIWLRENDPNYETFEEEIKKVGLGDVEQDLADEYWQEQYKKYLDDGGLYMDFKEFMKWQLSAKMNNKINKIVKDKKESEGIASILALGPTSKI